MRQPLVSVLLLATVALSSSNLLPFNRDPIDLSQRDNTFRNRLDNRDIFYNIFCNHLSKNHQDDEFFKICKYFRPTDQINEQNNNEADNDYLDDKIERDDNYDGEGFRKEQWHNYPRQLDRLQKYPFDRDKSTSSNRNKNKYVISTNEYILGGNDNINSVYDALVETTNPLLVLKIRLSCLNDQRSAKNFTKINEELNENYWNPQYEEEQQLTKAINPAVDVLNYNRNEIPEFGKWDDVPTSSTENLPVKKRIFSLWSRLQSLSHEKGHELHHRRYLHALYGHPALSLGGDAGLTAETRAALMRPPGSPLRWG